MRKCLLIIILVMLFSITGCTKVDDDTTTYNQVVVSSLSKKSITNDVGLGYKFYVPRGVKLIDNFDYNQTFLIDNVYLYLYVDIVSYYYKKDLIYDNSSDDSEFYYRINYNGKKGYVKIVRDGSIYYIKIIYNYSKIETYTTKKSLNKVLSNSIIILNNIEYKKKMIKNIIDESMGAFSDVTYELLKPEDASNNFSHYLEEYVQEDTSKNEKLPDE